MRTEELWARGWTAFILALLGAAQFLFPDRFYKASSFFRRAYANLTPAQSERLRRVLEARCDAEGASSNPTRYTGLFGIAMAALEFVPAIPLVAPYAVYCLAGAIGMLSSYLRVRRATERRTAPLVRRSPFDALPPLALVAIVGCFAGVCILIACPPYQAESIAVAISMLMLFWIAWRIATSQAVMFGDDPQLEYAVDERLRVSRATGTVGLACAPAVILVGTSVAWIGGVSAGYHTLAYVAMALTYGSFFVAMIMCGLATRRTSAGKLVNGTTG